MGSLTLQFSPCDDFCHNPNASSLNSVPVEGSDGKPNIVFSLDIKTTRLILQGTGSITANCDDGSDLRKTIAMTVTNSSDHGPSQTPTFARSAAKIVPRSFDHRVGAMPLC